jgi:uncharacterized protein (TIGR03437 family)
MSARTSLYPFPKSIVHNPAGRDVSSTSERVLHHALFSRRAATESRGSRLRKHPGAVCAALLAVLILSGGLHAQVLAVGNGASFRTDQPVTPGSWVTAVGTFAGVSNTTATGFPLPKTLGGVTVTVAGADAPLYFVSSTQINFLIPYVTPAGVQSMQVKAGGATFDSSVRVSTASPGLFTKDTQSPPKGAILNQDFGENTSSHQAQRGEVIQIYGTGAGALNGTAEDGAAAPSDPLITTKSTPQVFIDGVQAQVQFSGLAPGFPGVWQVNAFVPDKPFISGRVPVQVFIDGVDSNEVGVFVQP